MGEIPRLPEPLHEMLVLWDAYNVLARYVSRADPREADPQSVYGAIVAIGDRAEALLYAHAHAETMEACTQIVNELLVMLRDGRRPRSPREAGLGAEYLAGPKPDPDAPPWDDLPGGA